jgi:hypothetical protein
LRFALMSMDTLLSFATNFNIPAVFNVFFFHGLSSVRVVTNYLLQYHSSHQ